MEEKVDKKSAAITGKRWDRLRSFIKNHKLDMRKRAFFLKKAKY
jgi:hypothetical protein